MKLQPCLLVDLLPLSPSLLSILSSTNALSTFAVSFTKKDVIQRSIIFASLISNRHLAGYFAVHMGQNLRSLLVSIDFENGLLLTRIEVSIMPCG